MSDLSSPVMPAANPAKIARLRVSMISFIVWMMGVVTFYLIVDADHTIHILEGLSLGLFSILFGWIAFSFSLALEGFFGRVGTPHDRGEQHAAEPPSPQLRTAILMPVYNECPTRVFAAVAAMKEQLEQVDRSCEFDFFILSDSTDKDVWLEEEWCWSELTGRLQKFEPTAAREPGEVGVYYRHRSDNKARKAGNVADFCEHWGAQYRYMIVLDADSLMTAETMNEMVVRMDADVAIGILQVPPTPVGRRSLFARMQQFAAAVYGPMYAEGFHRFAGDHGNYWGHNAIIRTAAFMRHCSLPILEGEAPLGGEILSHDFVEAALMVRNGWKVKLANDLGGSYEECPTTILDFIKRDHRWCQGNLQHWQIMLAERIHPLTRMHFLSGILSYVAAPLWLAFLAASIAAALINAHWSGESLAASSISLATALFIGSMALLLLPKVLAVISFTADPQRRKRLGGTFRIATSALVETILSTALAPLIAIFHSRCVISVLAGHNVQWTAQQRSETGVSWSEAFAQMGAVTLFGILSTAALALLQPAWLIWFSPLIVGWVFAIPLTVMLGSRNTGRRLARWGLLQIESERHPEPILSRHLYWIDEIQTRRSSDENRKLFHRLTHDSDFRKEQLRALETTSKKLQSKKFVAQSIGELSANPQLAVPVE